jgi:hypothetical protein
MQIFRGAEVQEGEYGAGGVINGAVRWLIVGPRVSSQAKGLASMLDQGPSTGAGLAAGVILPRPAAAFGGPPQRLAQAADRGATDRQPPRPPAASPWHGSH